MSKVTDKSLYLNQCSFEQIYKGVDYFPMAPIVLPHLEKKIIYEDEDFYTIWYYFYQYDRIGLFEYKKLKIYRKIIFENKSGTGTIIGITTKKEGIYQRGNQPSFEGADDGEQAYLDTKKTYTFYIVSTGWNKTVLALKETVKIL